MSHLIRPKETDASQRRQVSNQRRERHLVEQRLPDRSIVQPLGRNRLARQAVITDQADDLRWLLRSLGLLERPDQLHRTHRTDRTDRTDRIVIGSLWPTLSDPLVERQVIR